MTDLRLDPKSAPAADDSASTSGQALQRDVETTRKQSRMDSHNNDQQSIDVKYLGRLEPLKNQDGKMDPLRLVREVESRWTILDKDKNGFVSNEELLAQLRKPNDPPADRAVAQFLLRLNEPIRRSHKDLDSSSTEKLGISMRDVEAYSDNMYKHAYRLLVLGKGFSAKSLFSQDPLEGPIDVLRFKRFDLNGDGSINREELSRVSAGQGPHGDKEDAKSGIADNIVAMYMESIYPDLERRTASWWQSREGVNLKDLEESRKALLSKEHLQTFQELQWNADSGSIDYANKLQKMVVNGMDKIDYNGNGKIEEFEIKMADRDNHMSIEGRIAGAFLHYTSEARTHIDSDQTSTTKEEIEKSFESLNPSRRSKSTPFNGEFANKITNFYDYYQRYPLYKAFR